MKRTFFTSLILFFTFQVYAQDADKIISQLSTTWYSVRVGEPEGGPMNPTTKPEVLTFNTDGTMSVKQMRDEKPVEGTWEYNPESGIKVTFDFNGEDFVIDISIREISDTKVVLVFPQKATEYSSTPPDPNATPEPEIKPAPLVVGSVSTINVEEWSGLHPFNIKRTYTADDQVEEAEAIGVLILLYVDGKQIIRLNEDGNTTDIPVSGGSDIAGEKHFGLVTEDPEMAGEIVFRQDNSWYFYRDKDQSAVEYFNE